MITSRQRIIRMSVLINAYAERLKAIGRSVETIKTRCRVLRQADNAMPRGLEQANGDDVSAFLAARPAAWSKTTCYSHLRGFYRTMVKSGRMTIDPTDDVERPKCGDSIPNPVEDEDLLRALERSPDQPWRTAIILGAYAGLRCCEIVALDRADVTSDHVHVVRGKGGKGRRVPTHPAVWQLVRDLPAGLIVHSQLGCDMSAGYLSKAARHHFDRIGLPDVHMHRFRHWFGTTLCDQGVGIEVVKELMGHKSIATTQGYVRVSVERRRSAMLALPSIEYGPDSTRPVLSAA
jgi:integrase/recombinase XerD